MQHIALNSPTDGNAVTSPQNGYTCKNLRGHDSETQPTYQQNTMPNNMMQQPPYNRMQNTMPNKTPQTMPQKGSNSTCNCPAPK